MMASAGPPSASGFLPLLESLEDTASGQAEQTDAYLTIANRLSGEEGRQFLPAVEKHFPRLGKMILAHISSSNAELSQAALQALGFCVYHSHVVSGVSEMLTVEILSALCSLVVKSTDKNTCTRALWVISKQSFPSPVVANKVPSVLNALESVWSRDDIQSVVMEHEALNVIIRMLEQVPAPMGDGVVTWAKLVIPLVVHSASKVRLRAAAAMEMGMPLMLEKRTEVAAIIEPLMSTKLIPELQKLFMSKNETNVLKLWPLFVRLLGKLLHKGGPFINSLLHLEELGFRSSSPTIKKIAFLAWKSLIDNFALNPDILCSSKRMKLLMQPLASIHVRTEPLLLTKVEVWWYLIVQLGPNLSHNFEQVSVPLLQVTIGSDSSSVPGTPSRAGAQNGGLAPSTPKNGTGPAGFNSPAATPRMNLNSSISVSSTFPSIQLLGLEMLLHYFIGPEVVASAARDKLILSLEPLKHPFLSGASSFTKHAAILISNVRDGFIGIGKDAPEPLLTLIWTSLVRFVNLSIESGGSKKDRQGCEVLTLTLQALQSIVASEALPSKKVLLLIEATVKGIPPRVLGSASYQVGKMDVLNGTPALFLIQLLYDSNMLSAYVEDERFCQCLQTLVTCGLSGPTSPLAFGEAVLGAIKRSARTIQNKELLWRMWSVVVSSLTESVTQSNEVNQGDALEHNFSAMYSALMFPITHLLNGTSLEQASQKSMLSTWSKLYKVFACCSALVVTAEENICCEELCNKMATKLDKDNLKVPSTLNAVSSILQVMAESADFSPYTAQFQQKIKSPHTPGNWMKKKNKALGNLSTFQCLLVQSVEVYLDECDGSSETTGAALVSVLSTLFTNLVLGNAVKELLTAIVQPLTLLYKQAANEPPTFTAQFGAKLEKLLSEVLSCLQTRSTLAFNSDLLELMSPLLSVLFLHKNKHIRNTVTQFWNATFANAVSLNYPEELGPVLTQVKQRTPIILPGFEVVRVSDEFSAQDSSESSQLETKLSGIPVVSVGKRDSLLGQRPESQDKGFSRTSKLATKLDFGSPKPPRREVLEEEASVDFVFIPPETKQRVLTEHQKEVKRTKRVDIPAMYNNLDASLDTTVFTQYTQSQEDSMDTQPTEPAENVTRDEEAIDMVSTSEVPNAESEVVAMETQDFASPKSQEKELSESTEQPEDEVIPESTDVSMEEEEAAQSEDTMKDTNSHSKESPNLLDASSEVLSGTPQKGPSRRQSFITLEKYREGKPASPSSASTFTGPLVKTSNSQKISPSVTSSQTDGGNTQESSVEAGKGEKISRLDDTPESPRLPKEGREIKGVKLTDRLPSDTTEDEDVIPDTQTETEAKSKQNAQEKSDRLSQAEESQDSSNSQTSQEEPRRSGRQRVRPLLPGEDPEERDEKFSKIKSRRSVDKSESEKSLKSSSLQGRQTRSKSAEEDKGKLRTRLQKCDGGSGKKKVRLFSSSQDFMNKPDRRRSIKESSQTDLDSQSENESQSQGRRGPKSKTTPETDVVVEIKKKDYTEQVCESQSATPDNLEPEEQKGEGEKLAKSESQTDAVEEASNDNDTSQKEASTVQSESQNKSELQDSKQTKENFQEICSQEESQSTTSSSDGQSRRRSTRSKVVSETAESKDLNEIKATEVRPTRSQQVEAKPNVRTRRSMALEDTAKSSRTPENSQSLDSQELSQGKGRRATRRSASLPETEVTVKSESWLPLLNRKAKKLKVQLSYNPLMFGTKDEGKIGKTMAGVVHAPKVDDSQNVDLENSEQKSQSTEVENCDNSPKSETLDRNDDNVKNEEDALMDVDFEAKTEHAELDAEQPRSESPSKIDNEPTDANVDLASSQQPDEVEMVDQKSIDTAEIDNEPTDANVELSSPQQPEEVEMTEDPKSIDITEDQIEERATEVVTEDPSSEEEEPICDAVEVAKRAVDQVDVAQVAQTSSDDAQVEVDHQDNATATIPEPIEMPQNSNADDMLEEEEELATIDWSENQPLEVSEGIAPLQEDNTEVREGEENEENVDVPQTTEIWDGASEAANAAASTDSPVKQTDLEAVLGPDVGQSPNSRTKGTWSPSASPSTSILKKAQKRPLEAETPSPLIKSRRVSFANPIQHQELADDIDRRSPALRTSSPRRTKIITVAQPKFITTPTKGLSTLSPRNLNSPGYKSSKKCLISEMGQEPRPVNKDCIYPALVGCTAPVEAVLPQIASTMWSRGFGQLVRARNIKTVGDLSALTPTEIKVLPIRSPKISNVKKALRVYEQQRKGRGVDELKSFDETERLTSEVEENTAQNQDQEELKTPTETLATVLVFADEKMDQDAPGTPQTTDQSEPETGPRTPEGLVQTKPSLLSQFESLNSKTTPEELGQCSPQDLLSVHQTLGDLMTRVAVEMHSRLAPSNQS